MPGSQYAMAPSAFFLEKVLSRFFRQKMYGYRQFTAGRRRSGGENRIHYVRRLTLGQGEVGHVADRRANGCGKLFRQAKIEGVVEVGSEPISLSSRYMAPAAGEGFHQALATHDRFRTCYLEPCVFPGNQTIVRDPFPVGFLVAAVAGGASTFIRIVGGMAPEAF